MATIKISGLTAATSASGTQELEVNESGTSKKITGSQLLSYIEGEISSSPTFTGQVSVDDGTVSAPSITNTGDSNTGIFFPAADTIAFAEGGTEAMRIDSSGNIGIGTSSPGGLLGLYSATDSTLRVRGDASSSVLVERASTDTSSPFFQLRKARGTIASPTAVASGDIIGQILFTAYGGTNNRNLSVITANVETYTSDTNISSNLRFFTTPAGTVTTTERMRIDSSGNVGIGTSSPSAKLDVNGAVSVSGDGSDVAIYMNGSDAIRNTGTGSIMYLDVAAGSSTQGQFVFRSSNAYTERMRIDSSGNVGIGITPSGSNTGVGYASIQVKTWWLQAAGEYSFNYTNAYDAGSGVKYITSGAATAYTSEQGVHIWQTAPTGTFGNSVTFSERMRIANNGNVGIGTSSPGAKLQIYEPTSAAAQIRVLANGGQQAALQLAGNGTTFGTTSFDIFQDGGSDAYVNNRANASLQFRTNDTERMRITSSGNVGIGTNAPATLCHINGTIRYTNRPAAGTITAIGYDANGDLKNSSSSLRYKHDINDYDKGLDTVLQLRPVTFKFNGETRENSGFIAEEVDALGLNEVMLYDEENRPDGVLYSNMVALLTKAIQEQQAIISDLQARISTLENN